MAGTDTYQIQIGEHSILGAFAHMSIRFVEVDTGRRLVEINGLATERANPTQPRAVGLPWRDDIRGHVWDDYPRSFWDGPRTVSTDVLATRPMSGYDADLNIINAVVKAVNEKGITYYPQGPNSNSFAMDLLQALGFSKSDVWNIVSRVTPGDQHDLLTDEEIRAIREEILGEGTSTLDEMTAPSSSSSTAPSSSSSTDNDDDDGDGVPDWRDEDYSNIGHWTGDRDNDGMWNMFDGDDHVGFIENWGKGSPVIMDLDGDGVEVSLPVLQGNRVKDYALMRFAR
jgi:hypothetical protein